MAPPYRPLRLEGSRRSALRAAAVVLIGAALAPATSRAANDKPAPPPADAESRPVFLDIDRIVVTVFRGSEIDRHEMIAMKLELKDDSGIPVVQKAMPILRDAFVKGWNAVGAHPDAARQGLDIAAGRRRMLAACSQIVGEGVVQNVLIVAQSRRKVQQPR